MRSAEKTKAQHIHDVVRTVIGNLTVEAAPDQKSDLTRRWQDILSEDEFNHTRISELNHNTLIVCVDSSARAYQLNLKKHSLLKKIQDRQPEIKDIYFKVGKIK